MAKVVDARDLKSLGGNPIRVRVPVPASSRLRVATVAIFANVLGLVWFLRGRTDRLLAAVVDPLHPDFAGMERAFAGFTLYAVCLVGVAAVGALVATRYLARRWRRGRPAADSRMRGPVPAIAFAATLTAVVVLVLIEVLLFQDYGIHFYEFDVVGILADAALRRDLGIQPAEVARVSAAAAALLVAELLLCVAAVRAARWRDGVLARACGTAMLVAIPGGLLLFRSGEGDIASDRGEFEGALPFGRQLLFRPSTRPFIAVEPRLGPGGYPVLDTDAAAPVLADRKNIVFFVADGLRGDMVKPALTPHLLEFGARPDVIHSRNHFSTGHVSESGIFGLLYGLNAQAFNAYVAARVPAYPLAVLKRNGYRTLLIASSRLSPYPTDQLVRVFDDVRYPLNDDDALVQLRDFVEARRQDQTPYFVLFFCYTPHYPFTSAKPQFRRYPTVGPSARTNYMNDVLQADDYFRQTFDLMRGDYERGRTVVLATADHGEEIRDHGIFGHAGATFWNEKIVVPFFLGLPGRELAPPLRQPAPTSHVDVWPTVFEYLGATPAAEPSTYSDGRSLLHPPATPPAPFVAGRFFPYADRPSAIVVDDAKYWVRATGVDSLGRLCVHVTRATDLDDRPRAGIVANPDARAILALQRLQSDFWRFIRFTGPQTAPCSTV